ncbi:MAG: PBP1A family penicillin-binding protein [Candidatus Liptonbacteria bacterium]|nr:PBP1A family penicillin-binding protein [Candidatus Liptonbacteria bacterium]
MKLSRKIAWITFVAVFGLGLCLVFLFFYFSHRLPSFDQITNRQVAESTKIYDRTGQVLLYEISNGQKRTSLPITEIPKSLTNATIAIEDNHFYQESGISWKAILRAFLTNLLHGRIVQGGSTITQQLAKNAFLSSDRTFSRKLKEFILAIKINRQYSKEKILELYLNEIPYGPTLYGVESASQAFFNKSAKDLSLAESAVLAALPKAPSYYSPWGNHKKELLEREKLILKKMGELNQISPDELKKALKENLIFAPQDEKGIKAPHFVIYIQDYLVQKYGEDLVRAGGLKVITTLDWNLQTIAEKAVGDGAKRNEELYQGKNAALVTQDPKTGQILAMVGSRDYFDTKNEGNFNVAVQGLRQPGSALKPFVYLKAFEKGYAPDTIIFDVPTNFDTTGLPDKKYAPENFDGVFRGPITIRNALAQSVNIPAVKTLYLVGLKDTLKTVQKFGISTLSDPSRYGLSLVLGGGEVRLIDMVEAYSTLSEDGVKHNQSVILEVRDNKNRVLESYADVATPVSDPEYPRLVNDILSDVDARSRLYSNSLNLTLVPGHDIALKTGTSNDYRDAWVFGYTPTLVTGIWAGNNDSTPMQKRGSSILAALPIWHAFMSEALKNWEVEAFTRPNPITPTKPILSGDYTFGKQIHTILYYVSRENPTGPYPVNPESDPQFSNWESGVLDWAKNNLPEFSTYNQPGSLLPSAPALSAPSEVKIEITKPKSGEFINNQIQIEANLKSSSDISEVRVLLNNQLVEKFDNHFGQNYLFTWQFTPSKIESQNLLEIEVQNQDGHQNKAGVIIYK